MRSRSLIAAVAALLLTVSAAGPARSVAEAQVASCDPMQTPPSFRGEVPTAEQVLGRFTEVGMIDDAVFAQMWVTSRHRGRGLAGRALSQELRRKGVDDDDIAEAVATLDPEQEAATARALVDRKLRSTRGLATDARVRRLAGSGTERRPVR